MIYFESLPFDALLGMLGWTSNFYRYLQDSYELPSFISRIAGKRSIVVISNLLTKLSSMVRTSFFIQNLNNVAGQRLEDSTYSSYAGPSCCIGGKEGLLIDSSQLETPKEFLYNISLSCIRTAEPTKYS